MKSWKSLVAGLALMAATTTAAAQGGHNYRPQDHSHHRADNEITVSAGVWPTRPNHVFNDDNYSNERYCPFEISLEYMRHLTKHFSIGVDLSYLPVMRDRDRIDRYYERRHNAFGKRRDYEESILVVMPTLRLEWVKTPIISMYTRASAGIGIEFDNKADKVYSGFAFQVVPVGMTIGRKVYCRLEFPGIGYQGLATAGIGCRF